jgi:predicted transcriptional regulator
MIACMTETSSKRRDKINIIAEITDIAKNGALKTQIMYKANLSFAQLTEYLVLLKRINILEKSNQSGKEVYTATQKGLEFLQKQQEIMQLLNEEPTMRIGIRVTPKILLKRN